MAEEYGMLTWEESLDLWEPQRDVPARVARGIKNLHLQVSKLPGLAISQSNVNAGYATLVSLWSHDCAIELALELLISTGMVPVMVRVQDVIKLQPPALPTLADTIVTGDQTRAL